MLQKNARKSKPSRKTNKGARRVVKNNKSISTPRKENKKVVKGQMMKKDVRKSKPSRKTTRGARRMVKKEEEKNPAKERRISNWSRARERRQM